MPRPTRGALEKTGVDAASGRTETGIDVIGDIAIVRLTGAASEGEKLAAAVLSEMKNVKCVFGQEGGIEGEFRLRRLRHLAGEDRTLTTHRENGCSYKVDVAKCYFSPRLSTERLRVAESVRSGEDVLNMFAGVGPFSIPIAKKRKTRVTSCELNPYACDLHRENNELNRVSRLVDVIHSDAMMLPSRVGFKFDRILMPHPSATFRFLPVALSLLKPGGVIHYYRHVLGRDVAEASENLDRELSAALTAGTKWTVRRVREVGPRWVEMAAEIRPAS
ncbi:MAG: class I SAM-dependent methyltransferase family protein [Nitrososphaerales archaeon]|nr:class I SAM-dependent methyltransferase family protein [Nitrososphaerales archaeon]